MMTHPRNLLLAFCVGMLTHCAFHSTLPEEENKMHPDSSASAIPPLPLTFTHGSVTLSGDLSLPPGKGPFPAVVMIHGSGPQDRSNPVFKVIAEGLNRQGIATLNYDKRGTGKSGGNFCDCTYRDLADDALAGLRKLASLPMIDPKRIGIYGHSQGGMVATLAGQSEGVAFVILSSAPMSPPREQVLALEKNFLKEAGVDDKGIESYADFFNFHFLSVQRGDWRGLLERYETVKDATWLKPAKHLCPLEEVRLRAQGKVVPKDGLWDDYLNNLEFNPQAEVAKVKAPILGLYATRDFYVDVPKNKKLLDEVLSTLKQPSRSGIKEGNHSFVTINPSYIEEMGEWALGLP